MPSRLPCLQKAARLGGASLFSVAVATGSGAVLAGLSEAGAREAPFFFGQPFDRPRGEIIRRPEPSLRARPAARQPERPADKKVKQAPVTPGPHLLIVSIKSQRISLYSNGNLIAHSPVSTGTATHPTPHGVFSIIQRNRHHRSNIYSGAPMPYMQRLTWSGIALHQGALPGRPASHGCIRLPETFADLLWRTTKMGTRVVVARDDVEPHVIAHAKLFQPKAPPSTVETVPGLRKTFDTTTPAAIKTAAMALIVTDADAESMPTEDKPVDTGVIREISQEPVLQSAPGAAAAPETVNEPKAAETPAENSPDVAVTKPAEPQEPQQEIAKPNAAPAAPGKIEAASPQPAKDDTTASTPAIAQKADIPGDILMSFAQSLQAKEKKAAPAGPITVFVSRKDKKLYVRQSFIPLFTAPVSFRDEQPLGTHVFSAYAKDGDDKSLRWLAVTLPTEHPRAEKIKPAFRVDAFGRRIEVPVKPKPQPKLPEPEAAPSAASVLDRFDIAQDVVDRISEYVSAGSSLIVSDLGLGHETGLMTDFIVVTRQ